MAPVADEVPDVAKAWALLLALARRASAGNPIVDDVGLDVKEDGALEESPRDPFLLVRPSTERGFSWPAGAAMRPEIEQLFALYMPLCVGSRRDAFTIAHLAQTLDGRIATAAGESQYISGQESLLHTHRLRALFDVVLVGRRTVHEDDPRLTTRLCAGPNPVRVVIDPERRLGPEHHVFQGEPGETLLFCTAAAARRSSGHGHAEVVGIETHGSELPVPAILAALTKRGLRRVFVEGGGLTVSSFLAARALNRLHVTVAPTLFGSGRPSVTLPEIQELHEARALHFRPYSLGRDVLFDCTVRA